MSKLFTRARLAKLPWRTIAIAVVVCIGAALLSRKMDVDTVHQYAERLNSGVAFLLLTLLPLGGFPVTVLHVVVGIKFGIKLGLALVAASVLLQLLASYALVYLFRDKFARRLEPIRKRIPRTAHGSMCLFTMLLPGVPYFAKNYVLPLLGVPLWTYLLVCLPIHVARSGVAIIFGDKSDDLTPARIAGIVAYFAVTCFVSWWMFRRLRSQMGTRKTSVAPTRRARARAA